MNALVDLFPNTEDNYRREHLASVYAGSRPGARNRHRSLFGRRNRRTAGSTPASPAIDWYGE